MPGVEDHVPAAQLLHADEPVDALNVPAEHWMHAAIDAAPTAVEYVPAAQPLHWLCCCRPLDAE